MPQIEADPEELASFAVHLRDYCDGLEEEMRRIKSRFDDLRDRWKGEDADRVQAEFDQIHRPLVQHIENCRDLVAFLAKKAHDLDEWIRRYH